METGNSLPACPVETTLMLIGDKWKVLILRDLMPSRTLTNIFINPLPFRN